jgi:acyl-CoA thioester hydrolase
MKAMGATWVVRAHRIEYLKPCFSGEHIRVLTWIASFRRVKSLRKYRILRREDRVLLVEAETDWIYMDRESGRLKSIPQEVVALFGVVPEDKEEEALAALN